MNSSSILLAARPKTLPDAIVPVWAGCVLSWVMTGHLHTSLAVSTLVFAVAIQIATNLFNDVIDHRKGADTLRRLGPIRVTASGMMTQRAVISWALAFLAIAITAGVILLRARGWPIIAIAIPSLFLTYGYTGGPFPLAYRGMGELFVILFFGCVAVIGTVFIQTVYFPKEAFLLGAQIGCLSAILISINNLRDREEDRSNHKFTLAARWGSRAGTTIIALEMIIVVVLASGWILGGKPMLALAVIPVLILSPCILSAIIRTQPNQTYNRYLAVAGIQLLAFGLVFHLVALMPKGGPSKSMPLFLPKQTLEIAPPGRGSRFHAWIESEISLWAARSFTTR